MMENQGEVMVRQEEQKVQDLGTKHPSISFKHADGRKTTVLKDESGTITIIRDSADEKTSEKLCIFGNGEVKLSSMEMGALANTGVLKVTTAEEINRGINRIFKNGGVSVDEITSIDGLEMQIAEYLQVKSPNRITMTEEQVIHGLAKCLGKPSKSL